MKIKNEIRIVSMGKEFVFHNTVTRSGLLSVAGLKGYGKKLLLGDGRNFSLSQTESLASLKEVLDIGIVEKNYDVLKGEIYNIRSVEFMPTKTLTLTELALADVSQSGYTLFNYALVKDDQNANSSVELVRGKSVFISIKVVLQTENDPIFFYGGDNILCGALLGDETCKGEAEFSFLIGGNLATNSQKMQAVSVFNLDAYKVPVDFTVEENEGEIALVFTQQSAKTLYYGVGVNELILCLGSTQVGRYSFAEHFKLENFTVEKIASPHGAVDLNYTITNIHSIMDKELQTEQVGFNSDHRYPFGFNLGVVAPINENITADTIRYISSEEDIVVFLVDGLMRAYKYDEYQFTKLNTEAFVFKENIYNIRIEKNKVFVIFKETSNFVDLYEFVDGVLLQKSVSNAGLSNVISTVNFKDIDVAMDSDGTARFAVIINDSTLLGVVLVYNFDENGNLIFSNLISSGLANCSNSVIANVGFMLSSAMAVFFTGNYNSTGKMRLVALQGTTKTTKTTQTLIASILNDAKEIKASGPIIYSTKYNQGKSNCLFLPKLTRYIIQFATAEHRTVFDKKGRIYVTFSEKNNKTYLYFIVVYEDLVTREITGTLPTDFLPLESIVDVIILKDAVWVFTNMPGNPSFLLQLTNYKSVVYGLKSGHTAVINFDGYLIPGALVEEMRVIFRCKLKLSGG